MPCPLVSAAPRLLLPGARRRACPWLPFAVGRAAAGLPRPVGAHGLSHNLDTGSAALEPLSRKHGLVSPGYGIPCPRLWLWPAPTSVARRDLVAPFWLRIATATALKNLSVILVAIRTRL